MLRKGWDPSRRHSGTSLSTLPLQMSDAFFQSLILPRWDVISIILSVFLMTYTYIEAKSNYHRGSILILRCVHFSCGLRNRSDLVAHQSVTLCLPPDSTWHRVTNQKIRSYRSRRPSNPSDNSLFPHNGQHTSLLPTISPYAQVVLTLAIRWISYPATLISPANP